jgi:uncharacterized membrane protein
MGVMMTEFVEKVPPAHATGFLRNQVDPLSRVVLAALIIAVPLHFVGLGRAFWLDEAFTGGIAAQQSLGAVLRLTLHDTNGPVYYVIAHYWSLLFGLSNVALRVPSALAAVAAGWIAATSRSPIDPETKLVWAALLALWLPGFYYATEARCYMLLFCLTTINTLLFAKLIFTPQRKTAILWAVVSLFAGLTHYHALLLVGTQGLVLIALHRRRALSLWPACLVLLPIPFWLALQFPTIVQYLAPNTSWYWLLTLHDMPSLIDFMAGSVSMAGIALIMLLANVFRAAIRPKGGTLDPLWLVVFAGLLPALVVIAMGFFRPSFTERYLIGFAPSILLGLALIMRDAKSYWRTAPLGLVLMFASVAVVWSVRQIGAPDKLYSFEGASQSLIDRGTRRLIFFWDNPNSKVMDANLASAVGGFFFVRAGVPIDVTPVRLEPGEDPNERLISEARAHDAAILWVYDMAVRGTAASSYPYDITARDPAFACDNFGKGRFGIIACHDRPRS